MKQTILSFLLALLPLAVNADAVEIDGIYYNLVSKLKIAEVTSNPNKYTGAVTIPKTVTYNDETYNVSSIGQSAFQSCSGVTSVTILNSVTSIGEKAFFACSGLTSITIPNSVTSIRDFAFYNCNGLTNITISNSVTSIGDYAFSGCSGLTSITIPNSVTSIGSSTFQNCSGLTSITIPNSVSIIRNYVFEGCSGLTSVTIPNSVTSIGAGSFNACSELTSIIIGNGIKTIYSSAFAQCPELADVYCYAEAVPSTITNAFDESYIEHATLHVLEATLDSYKNATPWSSFGNIISIESEYPVVTIGLEGFATFCAAGDVDFSTVNLKAYTGGGFNRQTGVLTMMRVYDVPAGTGLLLKGEPGTYFIPYSQSYSVYVNLLKGVTEATNVNATEGSYVNYVLNNGSQGVGFYKVGTAGASLGAGHAYLQIPAETTTSRNALKLRFDDEDEATGIDTSLTNSEERIENSAVYDLQGHRVEQPQPGLYIRNGKKVIIK